MTEQSETEKLREILFRMASEQDQAKSDIAMLNFHLGLRVGEVWQRMDKQDREIRELRGIIGQHRASGGHCDHGEADDDAGAIELTGESGGAIGEENGGSGCGNRDAEKPGEGITE